MPEEALSCEQNGNTVLSRAASICLDNLWSHRAQWLFHAFITACQLMSAGGDALAWQQPMWMGQWGRKYFTGAGNFSLFPQMALAINILPELLPTNVRKSTGTLHSSSSASEFPLCLPPPFPNRGIWGWGETAGVSRQRCYPNLLSETIMSVCHVDGAALIPVLRIAFKSNLGWASLSELHWIRNVPDIKFFHIMEFLQITNEISWGCPIF